MADRPVGCPVNVVPMPQVHKSRCVGTCSGEWFPEELKVVPAEMAEEASTGGAADNQPLSINQINTKTTVTNSPTDYVEIEGRRPCGCRSQWPRRPVQTTLRMNSVSTKFWTIIRRPIGNCPSNCSKYLSSRSREVSWKWPKRPGTFVLQRSSVFWWKKFYHRLPK